MSRSSVPLKELKRCDTASRGAFRQALFERFPVLGVAGMEPPIFQWCGTADISVLQGGLFGRSYGENFEET